MLVEYKSYQLNRKELWEITGACRGVVKKGTLTAHAFFPSSALMANSVEDAQNFKHRAPI